jgi:hypothetical protein
MFMNSWAHVAVVRSGASVSVYVNGATVFTEERVGTIGSSTSTLYIGGVDIEFPYAVSTWFGNIADFRVVQGVAVYS